MVSSTRALRAPFRFAILGTGFWARYQLAAWHEISGVECIALYNRTRTRAEELGHAFGITCIYDDLDALFQAHELDFVDIITSVDSHAAMVKRAAQAGVPAICQKPMSSSLAEAQYMAAVCRDAGVPLFIHENWRWQHPLRCLKQRLTQGNIGIPFRARISYCSSFPVFINQPFLKDLAQFILTDMGSHILDVVRFLFGEAVSIYCLAQGVTPGIAGEDVATLVLSMTSGMDVVCAISYASRLEDERFPQTFITIEGRQGSLELAPDYWLRETTSAGTFAQRVAPQHYTWADPAYDVVHSSIVACNANLLGALRGENQAETTADDNLKTLSLVHGAYESARLNQVITL
ncbi:MAG: Gfo/Idh/MocA family protein [Anaerolineae bacterium]